MKAPHKNELTFYISYVFLFPYFRNNPNRIVSRLRCITIILIQWVVSLGRDPSETVMKSSYRAQSRSKYKDGSRLRGVVLPCGFLLRSLYTQRIIWPFHFSLSLLFSVLFCFFLSFFLLSSPSKVRPHTPPRFTPTIKYHSYNSTQHFFKKELKEKVPHSTSRS